MVNIIIARFTCIPTEQFSLAEWIKNQSKIDIKLIGNKKKVLKAVMRIRKYRHNILQTALFGWKRQAKISQSLSSSWSRKMIGITFYDTERNAILF